MYLTQGLHRCLQQTPGRTATVFRTRRQTFRQLGDRVARLAGALRQLGMAEGDRVSMLALNSDRYIEYMLSVWWGGGVLNPVNTRWSVPEIVYSLDDCDTGILIVDDHFLPMVPGIVASASRKPVLIHAGDGPRPPACCRTNSSWPRPRRSKMRSAAATTWPPSCTRAAPRASPRASCSRT